MKPVGETHGVARVVNEARVRPICRASSAVGITPYRVRDVASSASVQSGKVRHPLWLAWLSRKPKHGLALREVVIVPTLAYPADGRGPFGLAYQGVMVAAGA